MTAGQEVGRSNYEALMAVCDGAPTDRTNVGGAPCRRSRPGRNRHAWCSVSQPLCALLRSRIECFANRLKNRRRVATHYGETIDSFPSFIALFSI